MNFSSICHSKFNLSVNISLLLALVLTILGISLPHCFTLRYKSSDYAYLQGMTTHLRYMDSCDTNPFWATSESIHKVPVILLFLSLFVCVFAYGISISLCCCTCGFINVPIGLSSTTGMALLLQIVAICIHLPVLTAQPDLGISFCLVAIGTAVLFISFILAVCFVISEKLIERRSQFEQNTTEIW